MAGNRDSQSKNNRFGPSNQWTTAIVDHVVLDDKDPRIAEFENVSGDVESIDTELIGCIFIRELTDLSSNKKQFPIAKPFNDSVGIPIKGETVRILKDGSNRFYDRIHSADINKGNAVEDSDISLYDKSEKPSESKSKDYSESSQTTIPKKSADGNEPTERKQNLGDYFDTTQINKLKLYEGDRIIESRFGQSIRFSAYNNGTKDNTEFSPTIIIRNRQNDESISKLKKRALTEEDVNKDGSTIALTSNNYKLGFLPGTIDDGGSSDFKTKPINAKTDEPDGLDQVLINSGRIILSSKTDKMLFFSKGDYGFISDGRFTIDNGQGGADLDFGGNVNITTDRNSSNVFVNTGNGNILLNTTEKTEPLVRGQQLVDILNELIDRIKEQVFNTPSGPTAVGPVNVGDFDAIQSRLNDIKSTLNFTE
jgi:hypothetical protein